jgi:hypothetical protein
MRGPLAGRSPMLVAWFIFLLGSFAVSVLTLTYVQTRVWRTRGWRALRERPLLENYWSDLSTIERALLWPGIVAFFLTLLAATGWKVITSLSSG